MLGRVYEYFLGQFAGSEGKRGGEFYTPRSVVRVMVEMLEPYKGRVYDPCCGSGGMFVQSEWFAEGHEGRIGDIAVYGQESNYTTCGCILHHLAPTGAAGVVLANGSMSSTQSGEDAIRQALIEGVGGAPGVVDCMIALPGQLFYSTQVPVCLWFLARDKSNGITRDAKLRDRRSEILFIDARKLGHMVDRTRSLRLDETLHRWVNSD